MANQISTSGLDRILSRHDPEHDLNPDPHAPPVSWCEAELADTLAKAVKALADQQQQIDGLYKLVDRLYTNLARQAQNANHKPN